MFMLQFWKRLQNYTSLEWGMIGFGSEEVNRPGNLIIFFIFIF